MRCQSIPIAATRTHLSTKQSTKDEWSRSNTRRTEMFALPSVAMRTLRMFGRLLLQRESELV